MLVTFRHQMTLEARESAVQDAVAVTLQMQNSEAWAQIPNLLKAAGISRHDMNAARDRVWAERRRLRPRQMPENSRVSGRM